MNHPRPSFLRLVPTSLLAALVALTPSPGFALVIDSIWIGGTGDWTTATNWNPNSSAPNNGGGNTYRVTVNSGVAQLTTDATVDRLNQAGFGGVGGTGTLTVADGANITYGYHTGSGTTVLQGNSTISFSGVFVDGGRTVRNEGTTTWSGGTVSLNYTEPGAGKIVNASGATFVAQGNSASSINTSNYGLGDNGSAALFENAGTFRKTGSNENHTTTVSVDFNNTGTVDVQTGTVQFNAPSTHSGTITGAGRAQFSGGTHTLTNTSTASVDRLQVSGGTVNSAGVYNVGSSTTVSSSGTLNLTGTIANLGDQVELIGGTLNTGASNVSVNTLSQSSFGTLRGSGTVTVTGGADIIYGY